MRQLFIYFLRTTVLDECLQEMLTPAQLATMATLSTYYNVLMPDCSSAADRAARPALPMKFLLIL